MGIYLRAQAGDYAEAVLVAGDPQRIARLGGSLEGGRCVTEHRGLVGFTGLYQGRKVSVQCSGMGCPSMAMVGQELLDYGVRTIVRIGTCSAFAAGVGNGDLVIVTGTAAADGTTRTLAGGIPFAAVPDFDLTAALVHAAREQGFAAHAGPVVTVDVEPHLSASTTERWRDHGLLAVEMESAALFFLALRANARGPHRIRAAAILTVSDGLQGHPDGAQSYLPDAELEAATDRMHRVALEALRRVP